MNLVMQPDGIYTDGKLVYVNPRSDGVWRNIDCRQTESGVWVNGKLVYSNRDCDKSNYNKNEKTLAIVLFVISACVLFLIYR